MNRDLSPLSNLHLYLCAKLTRIIIYKIIQVFGVIAGVLTSISLFAQLIKRSKKNDSHISYVMPGADYLKRLTRSL